MKLPARPLRPFLQLRLPLGAHLGQTLIWVFLISCAANILFQNLDEGKTDQGAYMNAAIRMIESDFEHTGGRNRMPLYCWIQTPFIDLEADRFRNFRVGLVVNVVLTMVCLAVLWWAFRRFLQRGPALLCLLLVTFTTFVYRAPYYQAEVLFYTLLCLFFLMAWRLIQKPVWWLALLAGLVAGAAHLTKASILPMMFAFSVWVIVRGLIKSDGQRPIGSALLSVAMVVVGFLIVTGPYLLESKEKYGRYLYNVNSTFYIWYDSWDEVKTGTRAFGDRSGWPDMPEEDIPSPSKYFSEKSPSEIIERFRYGFVETFESQTDDYTVWRYVLLYAVFLLAMFARYRTALLPRWNEPGRYMPLVFAASVIGGYLVLFAFYAYISRGPRFALSLAALMLFTLIYLAEAGAVRRRRWGLISTRLVHAIALLLILLSALIEVPHEMATERWSG